MDRQQQDRWKLDIRRDFLTGSGMSLWVWYLRETKHRKVACLSDEALALWAGERPL